MRKTIRYSVLGLVLAGIMMLGLAGCGNGNNTTTGTGSSTVTEAGSTTVQPVAEQLAIAFMNMNEGITVTIQGGGSSTGIKSVSDGTVDIGAASRELKDSEKDLGLVEHVLAMDGIAVIVNPAQSITGLTMEQVRQIFAGEITNWSQVGGEDKGINIFAREEGSGTRDAFEEIVMGESLIAAGALLQPSNGAIKTAVTGDPGAIGFISFGYVDDSVRTLNIDGVDATIDNVKSGNYPISRPLLLLTMGEPTGNVKKFIDYCLGPEGQEIVAQDYIPVN